MKCGNHEYKNAWINGKKQRVRADIKFRFTTNSRLSAPELAVLARIISPFGNYCEER